MNKNSLKLFLFFVIGLLSAFLVMYLIDNYKVEKKSTEAKTENSKKTEQNLGENSSSNDHSKEIDELTRDQIVIDYLKKNHALPAYYLTKSEARNQGWTASKGDLCEVLPGKAIGGDHFNNREKKLPPDNHYYEADVNYSCGKRNADRIVFTKNGEVWLTKDHYRSFQKQ